MFCKNYPQIYVTVSILDMCLTTGERKLADLPLRMSKMYNLSFIMVDGHSIIIAPLASVHLVDVVEYLDYQL